MSQIEFLHGDPEAAPDELPPYVPPPSAADPADAPAARRRLGYPGPRSLTARLVSGVGSLVLILVLVVGGATYLSLRSFLNTKLDQQLQTTARGGAYLFNDGAAQNGPRPADVWGVALDPSTGKVLDYPTGQNIVAMRLSAAQRRSIAKMPGGEPVTVMTTDGTQIRVTVLAGSYSTDVNRLNAVPVTIAIGLSTEDEHSTLHRLLYLESLIGGAAVLLALLATTYGVRFSLRRLRRVTITAQEVATELSPEGAGLDRRVPDDEPDTEVGQLATSFNTMLAAVETQFAARLESESRMRQFMADASHELRTPLTSIRGYAELARMQRAAGDTSDDNLDRIESEGTRMSRLVEDLLMLARGEADGGSHPTRTELVDVPDLVDDCVRGSRAAFPERRFDMDVHGAPQIIGDRDQLVRVIRNLINNAAVHTAVDRPILVRAWTDDATVVVQVVDGGPGLSPEDASHVFERFWRADKARTRARGGSGLGLSIVSTIVRAHGGSVRFDSTVETGSTVTVSLPAAQSAAD